MGNPYLRSIWRATLILFFSSICFAQFSVDKADLIETTAKREFNRSIINKYLTSPDTSDIIAALLSISHSEDTSFISEIIKLDFNKYGKWISFALGQIGNSFTAKEFLWSKLINISCNCSEYIQSAIGKLGDEKDLTKLIEIYNKQSEIIGIEDAVLQFRNRNITNEQCKSILVKEFSKPNTSFQRKKKILFTLARTGSDSTVNNELILLLNHSTDTELIQLALMNFRIQKFFPLDSSLINSLYYKNDAIKIELVKCLPYLTDSRIAFTFLKKILTKSESSENLLIETLKALRSIKPNNNFYDNTLSSEIKKLILHSSKKVIVNEAIKTYSYLFGVEELFQDSAFINAISGVNLIQLIIERKKELSFQQIQKIYHRILTAKEKLNALELIISTKEYYSDVLLFENFILNEMRSNEPAVISIIADGIDSNFISKNSEELKKIILTQTIRFKNDSDFIEAEISLINLAKKISDKFQNELVLKLSDTELYSLRKYLNRLNANVSPGKKPIHNFHEIISNSFKYSYAVILTDKGTIEIKFKPEIAPFTVGNFITLSRNKFYNGIIFHRVVPSFVIQAGDPTGTGWSGPGYEIISEFSPEEFYSGIVGIASAGKDTEGSQFFIMQGYYPHLNGRYTLFAEVIKGLDVVMEISEDDKIISIDLYE